jgi:hypothetical protein
MRLKAVCYEVEYTLLILYALKTDNITVCSERKFQSCI